MQEDRDDEDYWNEDVPQNYWLTDRKLVALLAVMVHRESSDIHDMPATRPPGATRQEVRQTAQQAVAAERQAARVAAIDDQDVQFKKAKLATTQGMVIRQQNDAVAQLTMFQQHRDTYVQLLGEEAYMRKVAALLDNLPHPIQGVQGGNSSASSDSNESP